MQHRGPVRARLGWFCAAAAGVLSLAGCGGGSSSLDTSPVAQTFGVPAGGTAPEVAYDSANDRLVLSSGGTAVATLSRSPGLDKNGFRGYQVAATSYAYAGASPSGDLTAVVIGGNGATPAMGGSVARLNAGSLPNSGSANFSGKYVGLFQLAASSPSSPYSVGALVGGDVALAADFGAGSVSGTISHHTIYSTSGSALSDYSMSDIALSGGQMDGKGGFSGTATGGELHRISVPTNSVTSGGGFQGLFGGQDGSEVAGGVVLQHQFAGYPYQETGVFIANQ